MSRPRRFTDGDIMVLRRQHAKGVTYDELGRRHGVSGTHIRRLVLGLRERHAIELAQQRAADSELTAFVDALRGFLRLEPLYDRAVKPTVERFYQGVHCD